MKKLLLIIALWGYTISITAQFNRNNNQTKKFVDDVVYLNAHRVLPTNYQALMRFEISTAGTPSVIRSQKDFMYDSFGRQTLEEETEFDASTGNVDSKDKKEFIYDVVNGWLDYSLNYEYDTTNMVYNVKSRNDVVSYNTTLGLPTETIYATNNAGSWINQGRNIYTYDAQGNRLTDIGMIWNAGWQNNTKDETGYNALNQPVEIVMSYWNNNAWEIYMKIDYIYNAQNILIQKTGYQMLSGSYVLAEQTDYTYDSSSRLVEKLYGNWSNGQFVNIRKTNWTYDANNNVLSEIKYNYNGSAWEEDEKMEFTNYDNNYSYSNLLLPKDLEEDDVNYFNHKINSVSLFSWTGAAWQPTINISLTYQSMSVASVESDILKNIKVYPNPASAELFIRSDKELQVTINDMFGKQVLKTQLFPGNNLIDVSKFTSGIYTVKMRDGNAVATKKIIVR